MATVEEIVVKLGLIPHPEVRLYNANDLHIALPLSHDTHLQGGWYRRTYESGVYATLDSRWPEGSTRYAATSIHYLLPAGGKCSLHRIKSDELWFWHAGCDINVVELVPPAGVRSTLLGNPFRAAAETSAAPPSQLTHRVPGGTVFGCFAPAPAPGAPAWALVSCVVVPGFDFADWAMPGRAELLAEFGGAAAAAAELLCTGATAPVPAVALESSSGLVEGGEGGESASRRC